jgi:magnesium transporter
MLQEEKTLEEVVREMVDARKWIDLRKAVADSFAPELADILLSLDAERRVLFFRSLPRETANDVFMYLDPEDQNELLLALSDESGRRVLASLPPDDRTQLLEELPGEAAQKLLNLLSPEDLKEARELLGYPEGSVGRLMTPDYVAVRPEWTILQALEHIRSMGTQSETINVVYVVDERWRLLDALGLRHFVLADPNQMVRDIMDESFVSLSAFDDRQTAVDTMRKYDLAYLPVVDSNGVLVGLVTFDDVFDVEEEEVTEDFQRVSGMAPIEIDYGRAGVGLLWRKRVGWLLILLVADFMSSSVIAFYESAIEAYVALAFFIPMLIDSGGNTGTQSATLIIRGLSTGQVEIKDWLRVLFKELRVGLLLGVTLGAVIFARGFFWRGGAEIGLVVGLTMVALVLWANLVGAVLPIVLRKLRLDPAVVSSPFITTLADVTGLIIYFNIAKAVLPGI